MPTKDSQKTEDMLDQTFANFDSEVTGAETQQTQAANSSNNGPKKSSNMMVFIGAGVTAVGLVAYLFVVKPMLQQPAAPIAQAPVAPVAALPAETPPALAPTELAQAPVEAPITPETPPTNDLAPTVPSTEVQSPALPQDSIDPSSLAAAPTEVNTAALNPITPIVPEVEAPVVPEVKDPAVNIAPANMQSVAVVDELKGMFEKQTNEFKSILTDVDTRVGAVEGEIAQQKEINQKVDQRLSALENLRNNLVSKVKKASSTTTVKRNKTVKKANTEVKKEVKEVDSSVLVDKSAESVNTRVEVKSKVKNDVKAEKPALEKVNIHSIYGGRLWLKNSDGSLSTYSAGDKLPTGEVIKAIDDENFEVTTDKRIITN